MKKNTSARFATSIAAPSRIRHVARGPRAHALEHDDSDDEADASS
jgi:hypothetical protein